MLIEIRTHTTGKTFASPLTHPSGMLSSARRTKFFPGSTFQSQYRFQILNQSEHLLCVRSKVCQLAAIIMRSAFLSLFIDNVVFEYVSTTI